MKRITIILFLVFLFGNQSFCQKSSSRKNANIELAGFKLKNYVQLTLQSGFMNPVNPYFVEHNYTSGNMGFDVSYRVNREVALYTEMKYNFLTSKDEAAPSSGYIESTIGARYYIRPSCYRSSIFFEAGFGPFVFLQKGSGTPGTPPAVYDKFGRKLPPSAYMTNEPQNYYEEQTNVRMGGNAGIGAELVITNTLFFTLKSKINTVFESNGCTTYVTGLGGITIRF